jgi:hypothetical protein
LHHALTKLLRGTVTRQLHLAKVIDVTVIMNGEVVRVPASG